MSLYISVTNVTDFDLTFNFLYYELENSDFLQKIITILDICYLILT